ncbi:hypothetical protein [Pseudomaricurvus hydrocarbonicus]|nr:hypothetical protein [Aestuariicella hydrocarbonica]
MTDPVTVAAFGATLSMAAILVGAGLGGVLLFWLDGKAGHGRTH